MHYGLIIFNCITHLAHDKRGRNCEALLVSSRALYIHLACSFRSLRVATLACGPATELGLGTGVFPSPFFTGGSLILYCIGNLIAGANRDKGFHFIDFVSLPLPFGLLAVL